MKFNKLFSILSLLIIVTVIGCMTTNKAIKKVLDSNAATDVVGREWEKTHPCVNDTFIVGGVVPVLVPGKTVTENGKDSVVIQSQHDSVFVTKYKPIFYYKTDTLYKERTAYITDNRRLNIANDSLIFYKGKISEKEAALTDKDKKIAELNKIRNQSRFAFGLLILISGIIIFRKSIFK
jgi:hypothetical protein